MSSKRLYTILGVQQSATPGEIKKAYHQQALASHPDKVGEAGTERFKEVKRAYDILSDPAKRSMYDRVGDSGMTFVEGGGMGDAMVHPLFGVFMSAVAWLVSFLLLLFTIFISLKVDGDRADWNWATVFSPIWIMVAMALCLLSNLLYSGVKKGFHADMVHPIVFLLSVAATPIVIVIGLDTNTVSAAFFTPLFLMALRSSYACLRLIPFHQFVHMCDAAGGPTDHLSASSPEYVLHVLSMLLNSSTAPLFWALVAAKIDGALPSASYYAVFAPAFAYISGAFVLSVASAHFQIKRNPSPQPSSCHPVVPTAFILAVMASVPMIFFGLLAQRLEGSGLAMAKVLIPVYTSIGVAMIMSCCVMCVMCHHVVAAAQAQPPYEDPSDDDPGARYETTPQGVVPGPAPASSAPLNDTD